MVDDASDPVKSGRDPSVDYSSQGGPEPVAKTVEEFDNGMTPEETAKGDELQLLIYQIKRDLVLLPRHRSYSLAITKIEECGQWLFDRRLKRPGE